MAYVTALHSVDYRRGYPGWAPADFEHILTGELLADQETRNATASRPVTAADSAEWARIVSSRETTAPVIESWSVFAQQDGSWQVPISWHLQTSRNGASGRGGSVLTVITVVNVDGVWLASSDRMPQST